MAKISNQVTRNLRSAGNSAAKFTGRTTEKAAVGLFRWLVTDHSGIGRALLNMPSMGFFDTIGYVFRQFLYGVLGAVLTGIFAYVVIAYGIPFLIMGHF